MNSIINTGIETPESAVPSISEYINPRLDEAAAELKLKQIMVTRVTRDDLPDGGASIFARTIELLRRQDFEEQFKALIPPYPGT